MNPRAIVASVCFWAASWPAIAASESPFDTQPIPPELRAAAAVAESTGARIYRLDRAAWLATDALREHSEALLERTRGWITSEYPGGVRVSFLDGEASPNAIYRIDISDISDTGGLSNQKAEIREALTAEEIAQDKARKLALGQSWLQCAPTYNTSILASPEGFSVYLSPGFQREHHYQAGGYHLYRIDAAGERVLSHRSFTKGCIELSDAPQAELRGARPLAMMVTHLMDPQPTEVHVFLSLHAGVPLMVGTMDNDYLWKVEHGAISLSGMSMRGR